MFWQRFAVVSTRTRPSCRPINNRNIVGFENLSTLNVVCLQHRHRSRFSFRFFWKIMKLTADSNSAKCKILKNADGERRTTAQLPRRLTRCGTMRPDTFVSPGSKGLGKRYNRSPFTRPTDLTIRSPAPVKSAIEFNWRRITVFTEPISSMIRR